MTGWTNMVLDPAEPMAPSALVDRPLRRFRGIELAELNSQAQLLTRKDRKYLVHPAQLATILDSLPAQTRVLETETGRWANYRSIYLDTPTLDSYRLAARRRPDRYKVRVRSYLDSGLDVAEVKTKDRRGRTVKHRQAVPADSEHRIGQVRRFAAGFELCAASATGLQPTLTNRYRRATLLLPDGAGRATLDVGYRATDQSGNQLRLPDRVIVETKTNGRPSPLDRLLWQAGIRPIKFSKYSTAIAALHPELPSNRWHRVLRLHPLVIGPAV
jgi:hypothetical protein